MTRGMGIFRVALNLWAGIWGSIKPEYFRKEGERFDAKII